jgi:hypothetical protein
MCGRAKLEGDISEIKIADPRIVEWSHRAPLGC